jgi:hypothetical protein
MADSTDQIPPYTPPTVEQIDTDGEPIQTASGIVGS